MNHEFKYLELTRHHLYNKSKKMITDISSRGEGEFEKLTEVVFSSAMSLFLTYLGKTYFVDTSNKTFKIWDMLFLFVIAILVYCVLFILIRRIYSYISKRISNYLYNKRKHSIDLSVQKNKAIIDDFDNIAFDNLIISFEFLDKIYQSDIIEIRTYYFHEALYYIRTSVNIMKLITQEERRKECLNIYGNVTGIDVFRFKNACRIMNVLYERIMKVYIDSKEMKIIQVYNEELNELLLFQIKQMGEEIKRLENESDIAIKELKPE